MLALLINLAFIKKLGSSMPTITAGKQLGIHETISVLMSQIEFLTT